MENITHQELQIDSGREEQETSTLVISGVPSEAYKDPDKIRQILDILEMPKNTTVRVTTKAASSVVR